jgi:MinD superfamily P-loop ATPase
MSAVVNRSDLGSDDTQHYLASQEIEIAAEIPFRPEVADAYARAQIAAAASPELAGLLLPLGLQLIEEASP